MRKGKNKIIFFLINFICQDFYFIHKYIIFTKYQLILLSFG